MKNNSTLMEFPCDFQIKIIGINNDSFAMEVLSIARKHFPNTGSTKDASIRSQSSQQGNYLAITLTLYVHIKMVL